MFHAFTIQCPRLDTLLHGIQYLSSSRSVSIALRTTPLIIRSAARRSFDLYLRLILEHRFLEPTVHEFPQSNQSFFLRCSLTKIVQGSFYLLDHSQVRSLPL